MKITNKRLKQIIKEELETIANEAQEISEQTDYSQDEMVTEAIAKGMMSVLTGRADPHEEAQRQCDTYGITDPQAREYVAQKLAALAR